MPSLHFSNSRGVLLGADWGADGRIEAAANQLPYNDLTRLIRRSCSHPSSIRFYK
jgi:hypothetical protein